MLRDGGTITKVGEILDPVDYLFLSGRKKTFSNGQIFGGVPTAEKTPLKVGKRH